MGILAPAFFAKRYRKRSDMFAASMMGVAGAQQGVGDTIKDPYSSGSSSITSAFSSLALNLASAISTLGVQKLAQTTGGNVAITGRTTAPVQVLGAPPMGDASAPKIGTMLVIGAGLLVIAVGAVLISRR